MTGETSARALLVSLSIVVGCSDAPDVSGRLGEVAQADTVCAAGETIEGIDVSRWQEDIDWSAVAGDGIHFAIARAAYGSSKDTWFDANWPAMKSNGLIRGAYQWFLPEEDPVAQAQFLLDVIGPLEPGDLPPVADVEDTGGMDAATIADRLSKWLAHIEGAIGRKPIIYTGKYFWQDHVGGSDAFLDYPLWIPNYSNDCPNLPNGTWPDWRFFQYTSEGSVAGVSGNVDRDHFNGTLADLKAFAGGGYAAEFVAQSFPYAADPPVELHAGEELTASIELRNVGTKPWNDSTKLATTEPRDRESVFAGPEWPAPNRIAAVKGEVLPGETYVFEFVLHAPSELGTYSEYFGLVQESEAWFSDPGHGGPPDNQLQGRFQVLAGRIPGSGPGATSSGADSDEPRADSSERAESDGCTMGSRPRGASITLAWLMALALGLRPRRRGARGGSRE